MCFTTINRTLNLRLLAKLRKIEALTKRDQQSIMHTIEAFLGRGQ